MSMSMSMSMRMRMSMSMKVGMWEIRISFHSSSNSFLLRRRFIWLFVKGLNPNQFTNRLFIWGMEHISLSFIFWKSESKKERNWERIHSVLIWCDEVNWCINETDLTSKGVIGLRGVGRISFNNMSSISPKSSSCF
jgi:hypothetical protein